MNFSLRLKLHFHEKRTQSRLIAGSPKLSVVAVQGGETGIEGRNKNCERVIVVVCAHSHAERTCQNKPMRALHWVSGSTPCVFKERNWNFRKAGGFTSSPLRPVYTCDFSCDFWCDFAYKTRLTLPCTNVFFAKHRVDWKESYDILLEDILLFYSC